jgi:hypothetical protein
MLVLKRQCTKTTKEQKSTFLLDKRERNVKVYPVDHAKKAYGERRSSSIQY